MKTMIVIAYKKPSSQLGASEIEWGGFLKRIEPDLPKDKGIEKPLENVWRIPLGDGLRLLPSFHNAARSLGVQIAVLVSEDSTFSVL
jgi:hypothetical protein